MSTSSTGTSRPCAERMSAIHTALPPDPVMTATRFPEGSGQKAKAQGVVFDALEAQALQREVTDTQQQNELQALGSEVRTLEAELEEARRKTAIGLSQIADLYSRLGGESSLLFNQQTLRGYGAGRFVDNNLFDINVEMRSRVWETDIFNTHGILELAPFFDVGRVFHNPGEDFVTDLHPVGATRGGRLPVVVLSE